MTFAEAKRSFIQDREIAGVSPKSLEFYQYVLDRYQRYLKGGTLEQSVADIRRYFVSLRQSSPKLSNSTIHAQLRGLRAFYKFCALYHYVDMPDLPRIPTPKESPDPLPDEELARVIDHLSRCKGYDDRRNGTIVRLMLDNGMRLRECTNIDIGDIQWSGRMVRITRKGGLEQWLPFGKKSLGSLREYMALRAKYASVHESALWLTRSGFRLKPRALQQAFQRISDKLDIHLHPHRLRHTFAVNWIMAGGDPFTLQKLLGHETQHMTSRYTKIAGKNIKHQHDRFSPGDRF